MLPYEDDNPAKNFPDVNWLILIVMVLVFMSLFLCVKNPAEFLYAWGFVPGRLLHDCGIIPLLTVFTSMFLHADVFHLFTNACVLHVFGDNVEDRFGRIKYLAFYLICGIAATVTQSVMGGSTDKVQIGASGAITGVMAAYLVMFPNAKVKTWVGYNATFASPAWSIMLIWFGLQCAFAWLELAYSGLSKLLFGIGGIGYYAHIGGFICGLLLAKLFDNGEEKLQELHQTKWERIR